MEAPWQAAAREGRSGLTCCLGKEVFLSCAFEFASRKHAHASLHRRRRLPGLPLSKQLRNVRPHFLHLTLVLVEEIARVDERLASLHGISAQVPRPAEQVPYLHHLVVFVNQLVEDVAGELVAASVRA